jgi:hypothetical protein
MSPKFSVGDVLEAIGHGGTYTVLEVYIFPGKGYYYKVVSGLGKTFNLLEEGIQLVISKPKEIIFKSNLRKT